MENTLMKNKKKMLLLLVVPVHHGMLIKNKLNHFLKEEYISHVLIMQREL